MNLSMVSDTDLQSEYIKRFTLNAGDHLACADDVVLHLRPNFSEDPFREKFVCIFLNGRNQVIATETLFEGSLTTSAVYPREVIRRILYHGSAAVLFCHNHPSGNTNPSNDDLTITKKLVEAANTIDVTVHDNIIIAGTEYTSFSDKGLI
jgi:DNA repair protein RadC|tara:strand:- start:577 stop:1026 length:450 start_codon:yes stop_codon:yes gene_type:complete